MKILVPLAQPQYIQELCKAGADEFYFGFSDRGWSNKYGIFEEINRMSSFADNSNFNSIDKLTECISEIKKYNKSVFIPINSAVYSKQQLNDLNIFFERLSKMNIDGVIIGDPSLISIAEEKGLSVVMSTMAGIYNSRIAQFYSSLGVNRMILPRDLSISNLKTIIGKVPNVRFEVFLMRNGCRFSDSNCLSFHSRKYNSLCSYIDKIEIEYKTEKDDFMELQNLYANSTIYKNAFHKYACGLCSIKKFLDMGVYSLKIVGRADNPQHIINDVKLVKKNLEIAYKSLTEEEYLSKMFLPKKIRSMCMYGLSCYYPEVRFK